MKLTRIDADGAGEILEAEGESVVIGRKPARGLEVQHPTVSREHARLFLRDGEWNVADLNSSNGTFVNGVRITRGPLAPGDRLKLGSVEFRLEGSSTPAPAAPSPVATDAGPSGPGAPPPPPSPAAGDVEEIVLEEPDAASGDRLEPIPPAVRRPRTDDPDRTIALSRRPAPRSPGFTPPRPSPSTDALRSARSGGVLRQDLAQQSFGRRLLYVLVAVGFAYGLFRITSALTETVVPEGGLPERVDSDDPEDAFEPAPDDGR